MFQDIEHARRVLSPEVRRAFFLLLELLDADAVKWSIAGSVRRLCPNPQDLDLVVVEGTEGARIVLDYANDFDPAEVQNFYQDGEPWDIRGMKVGGFRLKRGQAKADIRICPAEQFGACLLWLTGPREFNRKLEDAASDTGDLRLSSWGLDGPLAHLVNRRSEADVYRCIVTNFGVNLPPELPEPKDRR